MTISFIFLPDVQKPLEISSVLNKSKEIALANIDGNGLIN